MRKDRIEERIGGIERDVKELRSEIRQELRSMMAEMKEFQELMIEDRIGEIREGLSKEYQKIAYDSRIAEAEQMFRAEMSHDCPPGDDRDDCIDNLVNNHLRGEIARLQNAPPDEIEREVKSILESDRKYYSRFNGSVCEGCAKLVIAERDKLLAMGEKFAQFRKSLSSKGGEPYFRQLPDDLAVSEIVEPLSHKARFAMLKSLTTDGRSYKELGEVTGYNGGHLLYHVNKLVAAGMIAKEEDSGLYRITDKGMGVMEIVKKMYAC